MNWKGPLSVALLSAGMLGLGVALASLLIHGRLLMALAGGFTTPQVSPLKAVKTFAQTLAYAGMGTFGIGTIGHAVLELWVIDR